MQIPPILEKYKMPAIAASMILASIIFAVVFFLRAISSEQDGPKASLLPKTFTAVNDLINKDKVSLKDTSFMTSYFMQNAKDYTTYVPVSTSRGRDNPFVPYDSPGSSR
jgi:hypothetical protein